MPPIDLVILDCDGVLVDSERITTALLAEIVTDLGWAVSAHDAVAHFKGKDMKQIRALVERRLGRTLGDDFISGYRARMAERFLADGVPPIAGAAELLDWLDGRGVKHAVASNGPQEKMLQTLGRIALDAGHASGTPDWYARFAGRCFSAYDINCWKPDPGLFLHAAREMHARPEACVVVEDSVSGVLAARAASMRVIAYADLTPADALLDAGASAAAGSMAQVRSILEAWLAPASVNSPRA
jgi:beta-phosphoglucomutase-like phosphatase (HAD superfamily)